MKKLLLLLPLLLASPAFAGELDFLKSGGCDINGTVYTKQECDTMRPQMEAEQDAARRGASLPPPPQTEAEKIENKKRVKETGCISFGNAYQAAAGYRDHNEPPEIAYKYGIGNTLDAYPQFNGKQIVNNVYFDRNYAYPVGGIALMKQMYQMCMGTYKP